MNVRLERLRKRQAALLKANRELLDKADAEERELTAEEEATFAANDQEREEVAKKIAREEALAEAERTAAAAYTPEGQGGDRTRLETRGPAWRDDPNRGFSSSREFFRAVLVATESGRCDDERLLSLSARRTGYQAAVGSDEHGTYSDPYGGFLVPSGFVPTLLQVAGEGDPTAGRTTLLPMEAPTVAIPARVDKDHTSSVTGGLRVYRRSETQSVTSARMEIEQVKLTATALMGLSYATEELIADSAITFAALLEAGFRTEFSSKILYEKIHGTGAGQMEGVLNAPCIVQQDKEVGQAADTIVYNNVVKMRSRCWGYQNAIWLYNQDCLPQLATMILPAGTGGTPMWQNSAREGEPDMLWGRPAFPTEYCPTIGDAGDLLLGNWSQYIEGLYQTLESAESLHVRFETNERTFRFLMRNDGRCWWRTALTPKKSAKTLSPFVKLQAR